MNDVPDPDVFGGGNFKRNHSEKHESFHRALFKCKNWRGHIEKWMMQENLISRTKT